MHMNDLVSIIIAAYNVDNYIEECISSVLNQTYSNIEVIVVDDCSSDNTSSICESFRMKDSRVSVIYNEVNLGVSRARNKALERATGKYVVFVDGDDSLSPEYVEYMIDLIKKSKSEMCLSINCFHDKQEQQTEQDTFEILSPVRATSLLLSQKVDVGCWNKIYNKEFLNTHNIRFSEDLFYGEGLRFITTVSMQSEKIGVGRRKVYYYRRNNAESATIKFSIKKCRNGWKSLQRIKDSITLDDDELDSRLFEHMNLFAINSMIGILQNNVQMKYQKDYEYWKAFIHKNAKRFLLNKYIENKQKFKMIIMIFNPDLLANYSLRKKSRVFDNNEWK